MLSAYCILWGKEREKSITDCCHKMPPKRASTLPLYATLPADDMVRLLSEELSRTEAMKTLAHKELARVSQENTNLQSEIQRWEKMKVENERGAQEKAALLAEREQLWSEASGQPVVEAFLDQYLPRELHKCRQCGALMKASGLQRERCVCGSTN